MIPANLTQPKPSSFPGAKNIVNGTLTAQGHIADTCCRSCVLSTESLKILHYVGFFVHFCLSLRPGYPTLSLMNLYKEAFKYLVKGAEWKRLAVKNSKPFDKL